MLKEDEAELRSTLHRVAPDATVNIGNFQCQALDLIELLDELDDLREQKARWEEESQE